MKNRWQKIVCIGLALIMLSLGVTACGIFGGSGGNGTEVPVVKINRVAPNNLDLAGMTEVALATPGEGAMLVNEAARIWVPPGAVANDTPVTIKTFIESPESLTSTVADAPEVTVISNFYDLGPDNTEFSQPVTVTLSYAEEDLPAGADENNIMPIYYNGVNWITMERQLDTEKNRVSFETTSFPGLPIVLVLGYAVTGTAITATVGVVAYKAYSWWVKDPVYYGKAAEYVTPNDATVQQWADKAQINLTYGNPPHPVYVKDILKDPAVLNEFISSGEGFIQFANQESVYANPIKPVYAKSWNPDDWQKPADYFKNGMVGDCKNVANAMASIFRHYGYIGKCADGYMVNDEGKTIRHGWLEVLIDGKPYYVGSHAEIMPLEDAVKQYTLTRPKGKDGERFFWDEKGQKPYVDNWWEYYLEVEINQRLAFPGGEAIVSVFGPTDVTVDIQLTLEDPNKVKTEYAGVTDPATGEARFTLQLALDAPLGVYHVTAYNPATDFSEIGLFCVDALEISASLVSTKVKPGEMLQMNVRLNKPLVADIWVDSDAVWTTDAEGYVSIVRTITADTPLGPYTLTLSAPYYGISKTINYAVWLPATLKVNITPEENAPGAEFYVNVLIEPAQVTRITMRGYSGGEWMTDKDGRLNILMHVLPTTTPGVYEITMEAPDLGLVASDTYIATLTPRLSGDINVCYTELYIKVNGIDDGDEFEARLGVGGQLLRCTMENFQIHASGRVPAGSIGADMRYDFTLSQDMSRITGSVSLSADNGAKFSFTFSNLTRDTDYEAEVRASSGIEAMAFRVRGTAVDNYLSFFSINDSAIGTVTDYFAGDDSDLIVVLYAATESQLTGLLDE